ncbi:MAG: hypothetical protein ACREP4_13250 [Stenotrophomonas sp.]|uniref:hypothetical protein n=1 Tax=Stenotrophomonas sp. TaxID=69392 RepID=UPI003D6D1EDA
MNRDFLPPFFTSTSLADVVGVAQNFSRAHCKNPEKQHISCVSICPTNATRAFTIAADFRVNGCDVLLPLAADDLVSFACTNRIAKIAQNHGGFTTSCSGPLSWVQLVVTATTDPFRACKALLREREQLMEITEIVFSASSVRCRNIQAHVSDLTLGTPLLVLELMFAGSVDEVMHALHSTPSALLSAVEAITGGTARMQAPTRCSPQRLVQTNVSFPVETLGCGPYRGQPLCEQIVDLYQRINRSARSARDHNASILRGIAPVMAAIGNDGRVLDAGAHAWAARNGGCRSLAHWELDAQGNLHGSVVMPVPAYLECDTCSVHHGTEQRRCASAFADDEAPLGSAEILASVALAQSLATLRTQALETLQRDTTVVAATVINMAGFGRTTRTFTDIGIQE